LVLEWVTNRKKAKSMSEDWVLAMSLHFKKKRVKTLNSTFWVFNSPKLFDFPEKR